MATIITILFLLFASSLPSTQNAQKPATLEQLQAAARRSPDSAETRSALGLALGETGDLAAAIEELETAVRLKSEYAQAHYNLGITYLKRSQLSRDKDETAYFEDLKRAFQSLRRAQELLPGLPGIHNHLGVIYLQTGDIRSAGGEFQSAIDQDPASAEAYNNLGMSLMHDLKHDEAMVAFRRAIELNPHLAIAHLNLENTIQHIDDGYNTSVVARWRAEAQRHPKSAIVLAHLGRALHFNNLFKEAVTEFRRALALDPKLSIAHFYLGQSLRMLDETEAAARHLETAIELDPSRPEFRIEMGQVLLRQNSDQAAIGMLRQAVAQAPDNSTGHFLLARALQKGDRRDEAALHARKADELIKAQKGLQSAKITTNNGISRLNAGQVDEAISLLRQALADKPDYAEAHCYLGIALAYKGDRSSIESFQTALERAPLNAEMHYNFGIGLMRFRRVEEAVREFRMAVNLSPRNGLFHCALGKALQYQGAGQEAEKELQLARELGACR